MVRIGILVLALGAGCSGDRDPAPKQAREPAPTPRGPDPSPVERSGAPTPAARTGAPTPAVRSDTSALAARSDPTAPAERTDTVVALRALETPVLDGRLEDPAWRGARAVPIATDWRGAPVALETVARLAWSSDALFFSFDCAYDAIAVDEPAPVDVEHPSLYRFDAVEVFLDPDPATPSTYVELEVGPRGHFLDIEVDRGRRPHGDVAWSSGMTVATSVDDVARRYRVEARVPARALGRAQLRPGALRVGLYRLAGRGATRQYLARFPTLTARPSFHVPERFGHLALR